MIPAGELVKKLGRWLGSLPDQRNLLDCLVDDPKPLVRFVEFGVGPDQAFIRRIQFA
jgi:hypothetical protein